LQLAVEAAEQEEMLATLVTITVQMAAAVVVE
jgi:hypothetical protein